MTKTGKTILVVDDDELVLASVRDTLESLGYQVHTATDGRRGLRQFDAVQPDLVISDIVMPEMEGIEFVRELRRRNPDTPLVVMSGHPLGKGFLRAAQLLGAVDTLPKPFARGQLIEKVQQFTQT